MFRKEKVSSSGSNATPVSVALAPILLVIGFLLIGVVVSIPAQSRGGSGAGSGRGAAAVPTGVAIATEEVRSQAISVAGRLEPRSRIVHSVPSAGFVDAILAEEGRRVAVGDVLFTIRRRDDVLELYQPIPVTARVSGRVADISVSVAEEVSAGREAVVVLGDNGFIVETAVSDKDAFLVEPGRAVSGRTTDGAEVTATLLSRSAEPDYQTGLFTLRFAVPPASQARIGTFVVMELPTTTVRGVFLPTTAVVRRFGADAVWMVTNEDTLAARVVQLGAPFGDLVHVVEGITPGTRYLSSPTGREREGDPLPSRRSQEN